MPQSIKTRHCSGKFQTSVKFFACGYKCIVSRNHAIAFVPFVEPLSKILSV